MKKLSFFILIMLLFAAPLLAQTDDQNQKITDRSESNEDIEELRKVSELPDAVKKARDAGVEEEEIRKIVKGTEERKLTVDEGVSTIRTLEENTNQGKSNNGISDFVFQQKAKGVEGKELGQSIKLELQQRHKIKAEEQKTTEQQKTEQKGTEQKTDKETELKQEGIKKQAEQKQKSEDENKTQDIQKGKGNEEDKQKPTETEDEAPKTNKKNQTQDAMNKKTDKDQHGTGSKEKGNK
ncbi:MAG: hypothetical protein WBB37_08240 [bacterium]